MPNGPAHRLLMAVTPHLLVSLSSAWHSFEVIAGVHRLVGQIPSKLNHQLPDIAACFFVQFTSRCIVLSHFLRNTPWRGPGPGQL